MIFKSDVQRKAVMLKFNRFSNKFAKYDFGHGVNIVRTDSDAFKVLGISDNSDMNDIKDAFRDKMRYLHPDNYINQGKSQDFMNDVNEEARRVTAAKRILLKNFSSISKAKRREYNKKYLDKLEKLKLEKPISFKDKQEILDSDRKRYMEDLEEDPVNIAYKKEVEEARKVVGDDTLDNMLTSTSKFVPGKHSTKCFKCGIGLAAIDVFPGNLCVDCYERAFDDSGSAEEKADKLVSAFKGGVIRK